MIMVKIRERRNRRSRSQILSDQLYSMEVADVEKLRQSLASSTVLVISLRYPTRRTTLRMFPSAFFVRALAQYKYYERYYKEFVLSSDEFPIYLCFELFDIDSKNGFFTTIFRKPLTVLPDNVRNTYINQKSSL